MHSQFTSIAFAKCVTSGLGAAALALVVSGCSDAKQSSPTDPMPTTSVGRPASPQGGQTTVVDPPGAAPNTATPVASDTAPILRFAWCLREKGLPAVVMNNEFVAYEVPDGPSGQIEASADQPDTHSAEATCAQQVPEYTPPNANQF